MTPNLVSGVTRSTDFEATIARFPFISVPWCIRESPIPPSNAPLQL